MRKIWIALLALLLMGCGREKPAMETVADEWAAPVMASPRQVEARLPEGAIVPELQCDESQVYLCDDYDLILETRQAGDLSATVRAVTGMEPGELTMMRTQRDDVKRYDFVWSCAGENGEVIGRGAILDDGCYHYCMSVLRDADKIRKSQIVWSDVFGSFRLT